MLEEKATLKDHNGRYWDDKMVMIGKHLYFGTGWEEFVKGHFLEDRDLFIFKRLGNFLFSVKIFGRNGCKKKVEAVSKIVEALWLKKKIGILIEDLVKFIRRIGMREKA